MQLGLQHSYCALPSRFYAPVAPTPVADPRLVVFNAPLAQELGLEAGAVGREAAALFSGNQPPEDAQPIAMAYAGHQYGGFVPRLGDGRAILLGEIKDRQGVLRDLQLKGAGLTPFSRNGDGRAVLGPMLREYLISEAMNALGIPTTRSLAVVTTGEWVFRDRALPGAVLTRVAASHIRVGTFQYFAARGDHDGIRDLLEYVIARHYPAARDAASPALAVLKEVTRRQACLVADWMRVGFIHGVMNTDNMTISGETIDYGPCAFMDEYDPKTVFSSIDHYGRYAFQNQAAIAQWNLARLAETLLPLIDPDAQKAVDLATGVIEDFMPQFDASVVDVMRRKIGLAAPVNVETAAVGSKAEADGVSGASRNDTDDAGRGATDADAELIRRLLTHMQQSNADYTLTFRALTREAESVAQQARLGQATPSAPHGSPERTPLPPDAQLRELFRGNADIEAWLRDWQAHLVADAQTLGDRVTGMRTANPAFIPRNHRVEAALNAAEGGDYAPFNKLLGILQRPYEEQPESIEYAQPPEASQRVLQTFCGT